MMWVCSQYLSVSYIWLSSAVRALRAQADLNCSDHPHLVPSPRLHFSSGLSTWPFQELSCEYTYPHPCHQSCCLGGPWTYAVGGLVSKCLFGPVPFAVALAPDCSLDLLLLLTDVRIRGKPTAGCTYILVMLWSMKLSLGLILKGRHIDYVIMKDFLFLLCFFLRYFSCLCFLSKIDFSF